CCTRSNGRVILIVTVRATIKPNTINTNIEIKKAAIAQSRSSLNCFRIRAALFCANWIIACTASMALAF
ncbi:hypothetical protein TI05_08670, partial [Achromatium sp. WMS3]